MMKKIVLIIMLLGMALRGYAYDVGEKAPDFKVSTLDGKQISYPTDLKGKKPVYIVFWVRFTPTNLIIDRNGVIKFKKAEMPKDYLEFFSSLTRHNIKGNPRSTRSRDGSMHISKRNWVTGMDRTEGEIVVAGEKSTGKEQPATEQEDPTEKGKPAIGRVPLTEEGLPAPEGEFIEGGTEEDLPKHLDATLPEHPRTDP